MIDYPEHELKKALELVRMAKTGERILTGGDLVIIEDVLIHAEKTLAELDGYEMMEILAIEHD